VEVLSIALPRPRHLSMCETPEFTTYARQIREALQRQGVLVERQEREEVP
jgi:hypothetical protein